MADYGIKVSQVGKNVDTAADFELLMSSSFPLLKIHDVVSGSVSVNAESQEYTHNLGYPPFFWVYSKDASYVSTSGVGEYESYGFLSNGTGGGSMACDENEIRFFSDGGGSGTVDYFMVIFRLNLEDAIEKSTINLTGTSDQPIGHDFGIKVSKDGKSANSDDLRDFVIHSGTRSPLVHAVYPETYTFSNGETYNYVLDHDLGYVPLGYALLRQDDGPSGGRVDVGYFQHYGGLAGGGAPHLFQSSTQSTLQVTNFNGDGVSYTASIIALKDPFDKEQTVVSYP